MKKVLLVAVIAMAAVACKKQSECKYPLLPSVKYDHETYSAEELESWKEACTQTGGTWKAK